MEKKYEIPRKLKYVREEFQESKIKPAEEEFRQSPTMEKSHSCKTFSQQAGQGVGWGKAMLNSCGK